MESNQAKDLIKKYIDGNATAEEQEELSQWYHDKADQAAKLPYHNVKEEEAAKNKIFANVIGQVNIQVPVRKIRMGVWYNAAAILILSAVCGIFAWRNLNHSANQLTVKTITTSRGEHKKIALADGSVIWLSAESRVSYPVKFDGPTRDITFEGEAFFDIAKDKAHPFIVHNGVTSVRVLGTTFNINAYQTHPDIIVSLLTGKILFAAGKFTQPLLPGYKITYTKTTGTANVRSISEIETIIQRREGLYNYKNVRVEDVVEDINRNFNIKARADGPVKDCLFYGRIKPGENPGMFLQRVAKVVNACFLKENDVYIIKGGGCN